MLEGSFYASVVVKLMAEMLFWVIIIAMETDI